MVVLFPFQNHPHPSPSGEGLDSAKWVLPIALARDRLRAKGRARYGKLVGSSWRAAADPLRLFAGTDYEGAQQNRPARGGRCARTRSEEHTSELQSLMRISYAVFCLKKKKNKYSIIKPQPSRTKLYTT